MANCVMIELGDERSKQLRLLGLKNRRMKLAARLLIATVEEGCLRVEIARLQLLLMLFGKE